MENGIVTGYSNGTFRPGNPVTYGASAGYAVGGQERERMRNAFSDYGSIRPGSHILHLCGIGVLNGQSSRIYSWYPDGWGEAAPLTGLIYCADCGGKMYVHRVNNGKRVSQYTCSQYSKVPVGTLCPTQHRIAKSVVLSLVSDTLHAIADYAKTDRAAFICTV